MYSDSGDWRPSSVTRDGLKLVPGWGPHHLSNKRVQKTISNETRKNNVEGHRASITDRKFSQQRCPLERFNGNGWCASKVSDRNAEDVQFRRAPGHRASRSKLPANLASIAMRTPSSGQGFLTSGICHHHQACRRSGRYGFFFVIDQPVAGLVGMVQYTYLFQKGSCSRGLSTQRKLRRAVSSETRELLNWAR